MFNITYLLILGTGGTEKPCEQWEDMQVGLKTWQSFKDHIYSVIADLVEPVGLCEMVLEILPGFQSNMHVLLLFTGFFQASCPEDQLVRDIDHFHSWY